MKVNELLSSLFVGGSAAPQTGAGAGSQVKGESVAAPENGGSSDAVKLEAGLSSGGAEDVSRTARIAELKAQVQGGTYQIDRTRLAEAVARELF